MAWQRSSRIGATQKMQGFGVPAAVLTARQGQVPRGFAVGLERSAFRRQMSRSAKTGASWLRVRVGAGGTKAGATFLSSSVLGGAALLSVSRNATVGSASFCSMGESVQMRKSGKTPPPNIDDVRIVIYQYAICPFCNKVKAVLDFYDIPYETVEVNPISKNEIKWSKDYRKVPIMGLHIGENEVEHIADSPVILDRILTLLEDREFLPQGASKRYRDSAWKDWVDKDLAVLLFPNITRNFSESWQAFSYISSVDTFSLPQRFMNRVLGPVAMWAAQGKIKKKYGIEDEREAVFAALAKWSQAMGVSPFLGGDSPSIDDVCVFGCIRAIAGLDTHTDIVESDEIGQWYRRMEEAVGSSSCRTNKK